MYCFAGCVLVDPGRVPEGWHLARAEGGGDTMVVEVKKVGARAWRGGRASLWVGEERRVCGWRVGCWGGVSTALW